jgi:thiol:disulfide interchange protein DsbC
MKFKSMIKIIGLAGLLTHYCAYAAEVTPEVKVMLEGFGIPLENVRDTPVAGLYELQAGTQIYYLTQDGKYLITGNLLNMETQENLTDTRMKGIRLQAINTVGDDQLISFKAENEKHQITVFTDIDCAYCRKLHSEIEEYNKQGISVNYLFYPRTGLGSESYHKAVSVWCSKDRNKALTEAKAGKDLAAAKCTNPVAQHFQLGNELGVTGTPYIITEQGAVLPGYIPPVALERELDKAATAAAVTKKKDLSRR